MSGGSIVFKEDPAVKVLFSDKDCPMESLLFINAIWSMLLKDDI